MNHTSIFRTKWNKEDVKGKLIKKFGSKYHADFELSISLYDCKVANISDITKL